VRVKCRKHVGNEQRKLCGCTVASTPIGQCRFIVEHCRGCLPVIRLFSNVFFSQNIQRHNFPSAAVFCGCVTYSVALLEECMLQWVVENRSEDEEVTGGWRKLRYEESSFMLLAKYSGDEIHELEVGGGSTRVGGEEKFMLCVCVCVGGGGAEEMGRTLKT
jgi:hypothetical protein